jgi:C4-dicarboxylate transporter, DctM subunit
MSDAGRPGPTPGALRRGEAPAFVLALDRAGDSFGFLLSVVASTTIASTMFFIVADVLSRAFFNASLPGVADFVANAIVASVFVQLGSTIRNGRLISAEFLMAGWEDTRPALAHGAKLLFALAAAALLWRAAGWMWADFQRAWTGGDFAGSFGAFTFPLWPFKMAIVLGVAVALAECVRLALIHAVSLARLAGDGDLQARGFLSLAAFVVLAGAGLSWMMLGGHGPIVVGLMAFAGLFLLVACGMPVAFALMGMSFLGIWLIRGNINVPTNTLGLALTNAVRSFEFGVIPLFIMMGLLLERAGVGRDAFQVAVVLLRHVKGGLGIATVAANAIFAAITGSSVASAAVFSRIAAQPMVDAGHTRRFSRRRHRRLLGAGDADTAEPAPDRLRAPGRGLDRRAVHRGDPSRHRAGSDLRGAERPPVALCAQLRRSREGRRRRRADGAGRDALPAGAGPVPDRSRDGRHLRRLLQPDRGRRRRRLRRAHRRRLPQRLTLATARDVVLQTGYISVGILLLMMAANLYARLLTLSTIPMVATQAIEALNLTLVGFVLLYMLIVVLLGMILDSVSIMLIILPIAVPVVSALGGDLVWFGIVTVIAIEIGLLTPPFGLSVFVVKASLPPGFASLGEIFWGASPFVLAMVAFTLLLIFVPSLALVLL